MGVFKPMVSLEEMGVQYFRRNIPLIWFRLFHYLDAPFSSSCYLWYVCTNCSFPPFWFGVDKPAKEPAADFNCFIKGFSCLLLVRIQTMRREMKATGRRLSKVRVDQWLATFSSNSIWSGASWVDDWAELEQLREEREQRLLSCVFSFPSTQLQQAKRRFLAIKLA